MLVGWIDGRVDLDEVRAAIARTAAHPDEISTSDRLTFVDEDADLSQFDLASLMAVKDKMVGSYFGGQAPAAAAPAYRIALVSRNTGNAGIASLFRSVWVGNGSPPIGLRLFHDTAEALAWLGREPMTEEEIRAATAFL